MDKCTRKDTCHSGQCTASRFTCNSVCQYCNGNSCSLKTGFGFVNNKCTCKIAGNYTVLKLTVAKSNLSYKYIKVLCTHVITVTPLYQYAQKDCLFLSIFMHLGQDYSHQTLNPSNKCQWCDLYDANARTNSAWSNRPTVPCDDTNKCTKKDICKAGRYMLLSCVFQIVINNC